MPKKSSIKHPLPVILLSIILFCSMASPALAAPLRAIVTRTIESTGNVGTYNSLALDANYNPVVAYSNNTATTSLRLAYCQDLPALQ